MREAENPVDLSPGLIYRYYEGRFRSARKVDLGGEPSGRGVTHSIGVIRENGDDGSGMVLEGYIKVPRDGVYTFYLASDDGSMIWIGNDLVVDNDGFHSAIDRKGNLKTKSGQIALREGCHPIAIDYFDWGSGESLKLLMEGPGVSMSELSEEILYH